MIVTAISPSYSQSSQNSQRLVLLLMMALKGQFAQKRKFGYCLLTLMPMEGWVKFFSPRNTAGVSQEKGVAVMFQTTVMNGDKDTR